MYQIIKRSKIWISFSGALVVLSVLFLSVYGLKLGIDFTGGSILEIRFEENRPSASQVQENLAELNLGSLTAQPFGEKGMILRFQNTEEDVNERIIARLEGFAAGGEASASDGDQENPEASGNITQERFDSVGPSVGAELKSRSFSATVIVLAAIILYIAWAFRKVSKPVASWKYGVAATVALFHDVMVTLGAFAIFGHFLDYEINTAFVAAILTVLGYSVNDTIVVFDRIRENLPKSEENFEDTVNTSVNQTITRSINTSFTTLLVLAAILLFGGESIRGFVLALTIGIGVGTYSSIFLASPVLVIWEKLGLKKASA